MSLISVIVPVYKVEHYLKRCVDSLLNQTHQDLEIILVDDGSPDRCPELCDAYARQDSRIHVIHQKNGGLSAARNAGLDWMMANSQSQWLTFLDSDDWLHPDTLESLLQAAETLHTSVSMCGYAETNGDSVSIRQEQRKGSLRSFPEFYIEQPVLLTIACGKLYARSAFHSIRFPVGKLHEDEFTTYRILAAQDRIAYVPAPMYQYYINPEGITKRTWKPSRMDVFEAFRQQIQFFDERGQTCLGSLAMERYLANAWGQMQQVKALGDTAVQKEFLPVLSRKIKSLLREAEQRNCLDFDRDFPVLLHFQPVKTRLKLYKLALIRRMRGRKHA